MEEVIKKLLSAGNKFITEINFRQPGFTYSACGSVTKKKERLQKSKERGGSKYIDHFQYYMVYKDFQDLP